MAGDTRFGFATHFGQGWSKTLMPAVAATGVGWIRDDVSWASMNPSNGVFQTDTTDDGWLQAAGAAGLQVVAIIGSNAAVGTNPPYDPTQMAAFCAWFAGHYAGIVGAVEILNEPNNISAFNTTAGEQNYITLVNTVYAAVAVTNTNCQVIGLGYQGSTILNLLPQATMNGVVVHPYDPGTSPDIVPELVYEPPYNTYTNEYPQWIAALNAATALPIWETEWGAETVTGLSQDQQACYLLRRLCMLTAFNVEHSFIYEYMDNSGTDLFGVTLSGGAFKLAYGLYMRFINAMQGVTGTANQYTTSGLTISNVSVTYTAPVQPFGYLYTGSTKTIAAYWVGNASVNAPPTSGTCTVSFPYTGTFSNSSYLYDLILCVSTPLSAYSHTLSGGVMTISGLPLSDHPKIVVIQPTVSSPIIPSGRFIDWTISGIPGGIPSAGWPINATITTTGADQTAAINAALVAAPVNSVVLLGPGTFQIAGAGIQIPSGKVLRGAGPQSMGGPVGTNQQTTFTLLNYTGSGNANVAFGSLSDTAPTTTNQVSITGGLTQGSTSIVVSSAANISVGKTLIISQLNDASIPVSNVGGEGTANWVDDDLYNGTRAMGQTTLVTSVNGTTIGIDPPLYWAYNQTPLAIPFTTECVRAGLENLTIYNNSSNYGGQGNGAGTLRFFSSLYCWVNNIEVNYTGNDFADFHFAIRCEIRHSNFHDAYLHAPGQTDSDIDITSKSSGNLVIDNVIYHGHVGIMLEWGASGNVVAYNWIGGSFDANTPQANYPGINPNHGAHPLMNLFEGNVCPHIYSDDIWGSNSHACYIRNWATGTTWVPVTPPTGRGAFGTQMWTYQALFCFDIDLQNTYPVFIGNVAGSKQLLTGTTHYNDGSTHLTMTALIAANTSRSYDDGSYGYTFGYSSLADGGGGSDNSLPYTTSIIAGDYNCATVAGAGNTGTIWFNATTQTVPNSLLMTSKPTWFGTLTWPPVDPTNPQQTTTFTSVILPAGYRFVNGVDPPASTAPTGFNPVTVTFSGTATNIDMAVMEYAGLTGTSSLDVKSTNTGTSTAPTTGPFTTTQGNDILVGAASSAGGPLTAGSGYTQRDLTSRLITEDRIAASAGSFSGTASLSTSSAWIMQVLALKAPAGGPTPQTIGLIGIVSASAFGQASVTASRTVQLTGIISGETFGHPTVVAPATVTLSGILSAETFGATVVQATGTFTSQASGIISGETFGVIAVQAPASIALSGILTAETFGTATVLSPAQIFLTGIQSAEKFGMDTIGNTGDQFISLTGILSAQAFGTLTLVPTGTATVQLSGIVSAEKFGTIIVSSPAQIFLTGIISANAFGNIRVTIQGQSARMGRVL
jgi:hypothetical protein